MSEVDAAVTRVAGAGLAGLATGLLVAHGTRSLGHAAAAGLVASAVSLVTPWLAARSSRATARALETDVSVLTAELERRARAEKESAAMTTLVVDEAPGAMVLMSADGDVLLANSRARTLLFDGQDLVGRSFMAMLDRAPEALRRAVTSTGDELFSIEDEDGEPRTYHLSKRHVVHDGAKAVLVSVNDITREIGRREVEVWKQVIRVIAHEVHNSLAPMSTLASTGRVLARSTATEDKLAIVFDTVQERVTHLRDFLEGYAKLSRLPLPARREVSLAALARRMEALWPGIAVETSYEKDATAFVDQGQLEQVLLNFLKNASEAGSQPADTTLVIEARDERTLKLAVRDRGHGMSADVMKRALLPLFSTKSNGAGLGLALCREIAEAHGGVLRLEARDGGGIEVSVRVPRRDGDHEGSSASPLTLSRGGSS